MVIGEAPGAEEDRLGLPFQGRSGRLLRSTWDSVAPKESLFIVNTVRCRPPANRPPRSEELAACRRWLDADLAQVAPRLILTLGRTATTAILPHTKNRKDWRGWWGSPPGAPYEAVVAVWHPAAILRSRRIRLPVWTEELAHLHRVLHGEALPPTRDGSGRPPG